jgi:hypothetical protein
MYPEGIKVNNPYSDILDSFHSNSFTVFLTCSPGTFFSALLPTSLFVLLSLSPSFSRLHCTENPTYIFPEKELRSPNSYIHESVSDLYIPRIGPHIWLQQNRQTYILDSHRPFICSVLAPLLSSFFDYVLPPIPPLNSADTSHVCHLRFSAFAVSLLLFLLPSLINLLLPFPSAFHKATCRLLQTFPVFARFLR